MQAEERQKRIEEYLLKTEFASLDELSEEVDASVSTVRRDLAMLEGKGAVRRTHGGARLVNPKSDEFTFSARDTHQLAEKEDVLRDQSDDGRLGRERVHRVHELAREQPARR